MISTVVTSGRRGLLLFITNTSFYVLRQFTTSIDGAGVGGFVEPRRRHAGSADRDLRRAESGDTFLLDPEGGRFYVQRDMFGPVTVVLAQAWIAAREPAGS